MAEIGSDVVRDAMDRADGWFMCRVGYVETVRAVGLSAGPVAAKTVAGEWSAFGVIEVDQRLIEDASKFATARKLRSLDALHLASALMLPQQELIFATWDRRLHAAAGAEGMELLPGSLD